MSCLLPVIALVATGVEPATESAPLRREEQILVESAPLRSDSQVISVRPLSWEGKATVYAGDREIHIRVRTRISRAGVVVSESWPADQGEQALRRMTIDLSGGWMERGGRREPMPKAMWEHERQQFEFYAQLQPAIVMARLMGSGQLKIEGSVPTNFRFDAGYPVEAHNRVKSPEPNGDSIDQKFLLTDYKTEGGFTWPRRLEILQNGKPYFTLRIEKFEVGAVR